VRPHLTSTRLRRDLQDIARAALASVDPSRLVRDALAALGPRIRSFPSMTLVAAGKAAVPMSRAFVDLAGGAIGAGLVVAPEGAGAGPPAVESIAAGHPMPNDASVRAGRRALDIAAATADDGVLVVLLSGGASALLAAPAAGLTLAAKAEATRVVMHAGAAIHELNCVRKHLSAIKGGRLAAAAPASLTLAISDVVAPQADDPAVIGSGPTVADPTTYRDALDIVSRLDVARRFPHEARRVLEDGARGAVEETVKPGDRRLTHASWHLVGSRREALDGARRRAEHLGYAVAVLDDVVVGEAREAGPRLVRDAMARVARLPRPACVLAAGETTVTVRGTGKGGRNQELVLGAVLRELPAGAVLGSVGTDGADGPTDAAGAMGDDTTLSRAAAAGLGNPRYYLENNDTYAFFNALDDLIRTGPTGTNVCDLQVLLTP